jgi:hypothetical protein
MKKLLAKKTTDEFTVGEGLAYIGLLCTVTFAPIVVGSIIVTEWENIKDTAGAVKDYVVRKVETLTTKQEEAPQVEEVNIYEEEA